MAVPKSREIDVQPSEIAAVRPHERFAAYIQDRAAVEAPIVREQLSASQMDAIILAETPEELDAAMNFANLIPLRDISNGTEIRVTGFHVAPGTREDYKNSLGVFAVIEAVMLATGQSATIDTGVERIITYLRACESMDRFPLDVRVVRQQTGGGNDMITLQPVPQRVIVT